MQTSCDVPPPILLCGALTKQQESRWSLTNAPSPLREKPFASSTFKRSISNPLVRATIPPGPGQGAASSWVPAQSPLNALLPSAPPDPDSSSPWTGPPADRSSILQTRLGSTPCAWCYLSAGISMTLAVTLGTTLTGRQLKVHLAGDILGCSVYGATAYRYHLTKQRLE